MATQVNNQPRMIDDPFDDAMNAKPLPEGPRVYFGQMRVDSFYCVLVKGRGKVPFDPAQHKPSERRTAIILALTAFGNDRVFEVSREMISTGDDWLKIVKPSIEKLGVGLRDLQDAWVQVELVPTRHYKDKDGNQRQATTTKFLTLYPNQAACEAAKDTYYKQLEAVRQAAHDPQIEYEQATSTPTASTPPFEPDPDPANPERIAAAKFLPHFWAQAKAGGEEGRLTRFADIIANTDMLRKYFTLQSPEVQDLVLKG